jgi:hypothetical protein
MSKIVEKIGSKHYYYINLMKYADTFEKSAAEPPFSSSKNMLNPLI